MPNRSWVCFGCRRIVRQPWREEGVTCATCGEPCLCLGDRLALPPRRNVAEWAALEERVQAASTWIAEEGYRVRVRRRHELEQQVARLEPEAVTPWRRERLDRMRVELADLRARLAVSAAARQP